MKIKKCIPMNVLFRTYLSKRLFRKIDTTLLVTLNWGKKNTSNTHWESAEIKRGVAYIYHRLRIKTYTDTRVPLSVHVSTYT